VLLEATMVMLARTHANSILLTMAATMVAVARVLLPGHNHTRLLSSSDRLFARFLRRWRVAAHSPHRTRHTVARTEPQRRLWGAPMASVVDAGGAGASCRGSSTSP
jgi:hypothetical protein